THALTPAGRAALEKGDAAVQERLAELAGNLPPRKARVALSGLAFWVEALDIARARRAEAR
ncbi:MAG: MarR family transcriptional regulator, partial [Acidimicrobiia bacterium]